jgi:hypothetical protein
VTSGAPSAREGSTSAALGLGALGSAIAVLPAVLRVEAAGSALSTWLALAGGSALVVGPVLALLRRALATSSHLLLPLAGVGLSAAPLAMLGSLLKSTTHHRPLGAATFAVLALGVVVFCVLVALSVGRVARRAPVDGRRGAWMVLGAAALASVAAALAPVLRSEGARPHALDAVSLIVAGGAALGALRIEPVRVLGRRFGALLWIAITLAGLLVARGPTFVAVKNFAPVAAGPRAWL